ncbi:MAG TPA: hypothetical protein VFU81_11665, partial [Thermomicrobiales bacterium]|nr:hypothetical protein [Thermomicrobiales bacterium]
MTRNEAIEPSPASRRENARTGDSGSPFRVLPSVAALAAEARAAGSTLADQPLAAFVSAELERERNAIAAGERPARDEIEARIVAAALAFERPRLAPLLNATGVIIHTNLGRAPVSPATAAAMAAATGAVALELEPETNERGGRMREIASLMQLLTGAEAALVVNNGAAAVLLVLSA